MKDDLYDRHYVNFKDALYYSSVDDACKAFSRLQEDALDFWDLSHFKYLLLKNKMFDGYEELNELIDEKWQKVRLMKERK